MSQFMIWVVFELFCLAGIICIIGSFFYQPKPGIKFEDTGFSSGKIVRELLRKEKHERLQQIRRRNHGKH